MWGRLAACPTLVRKSRPTARAERREPAVRAAVRNAFQCVYDFPCSMDVMTRRHLAKLATGAAMAPQARIRAATYTGALDGAEAKIDPKSFDPVLFSRRLYESAPLRLTFRAQNRKQADAWQKELRAKLIELLGPPPVSSESLNSQTLEVREFPGYRREKFIFESSLGLNVLGYLLTPVNAKPPYAAVVCVPGHGRGVDDIIGVDENGSDRTNKDGYQHDF